MGAFIGRSDFGLFTNGQSELGSDQYFEFYNHTTEDSLSGDGCLVLDFNSYGASAQGSEYVAVDPATEHYIFSVSVKTKTRSYNNRLGSGQLGFACYDQSKNFISHHQAYSTLNAKLTRAATAGDTVIYVDRGDWPTSTTDHIRSLNFYFPGSLYASVGGYTRYNMYSNAYPTNGITQISPTEWQVTLSRALPNWGYPYVIGTDVGQAQSGGSFNYAISVGDYPEQWTTYTTPIMSGYVIGAGASSANFRDGTKYVRFLNLTNYIYRTEQAGNSARYYLDNIMLFRVPKDELGNPISTFQDQEVRKALSAITKFKVPQRGGQAREDFL